MIYAATSVLMVSCLHGLGADDFGQISFSLSIPELNLKIAGVLAKTQLA